MGCSDGWNTGNYSPVKPAPPTAREIEIIERVKAVEKRLKELDSPEAVLRENEILKNENKNLRVILDGVVDMLSDIQQFIENS